MPGRRGRVDELGPAENKPSAGADRARCLLGTFGFCGKLSGL